MADILNSEISVKETVDRFKDDKLIQALEQGDEYAISMAVASRLGGVAEDYVNNLPEVFTAMVGGTVESNRSGNIFKDIGKSFSDGRKLSHLYEAYGREADETKRLELGKSIGEIEKSRVKYDGIVDTVIYGFPELVGGSIVAPAEMTAKNIGEAALGGTAAAALYSRFAPAIGSTPYGKVAIGTGLAVGSYLNFSRIEKGASLYELDQITDENGNRLSEKTKQIAASLYGAVSGLIEFAGLENILVGSGTAAVRKKVTDILVKLAGDKVKNKVSKEAAEQGARRIAENIAVGTGVTVAGAAGESVTEVTQDLLYNAIEATVKEISNNVAGTEFAHKTWDEIKDGLKETAYNTFLSVLPLSAIASPSAMRQFSRKQAPNLTREEAKAIYDDIINGEPYNVAEKPEAEQTFAGLDDTDTEDITVPEVERTESGRLKTDIPVGYDTDSESRASYLRFSSDGQDYAFVRYHEDGEVLVIDRVDVAAGYEGLAEEVVEEFTRQNAGTEIIWDTEEGSVSAGIKDSIIAKNIDNPGALQRFRGSFADEGEAVAYISSKIPNLNRMQARIVTRLFRVVAEREGMSLDRFLQDRLGLVYDENLGGRGALDHRAIDKVTKEGKALFYFGKDGDMSTVVHELFHFLIATSKDTRELSEAVRKAATESTFKTWLEKSGGVITAGNGIGVERVLEELRTLSDNPNDWNNTQHEIMASMFETHITTGKTYNNKLKEIFDAFARWVKQVYHWLKTDKALNDDIVKGFDKLFEADEEYQQIAEEEEAAASGRAITEQLKAESGFSNLPGPGETDIAYDYDIDGLLYQRDAKHVKIALSELDYFTEAERERIIENLNKFKRTPWYWQAIESLLVRRDIRALMNGEEPTSDSKLMTEDKAVNVREACKIGLDGIYNYVNSHSFISNPEKPEFAINSSMLNCDPSAECAKFCYAARGNYVYSSSLLKSELVTMCIENFPEKCAEQVLFEYNRTLLKETGKALRIFDKGDISERWIPFIEALNKKGVPLQIFSKRPEFLSRVDAEKNVIMLSIDKSNTELAEKYTDLPIAYVYQGTEGDLDFLAENEARFKAHGGVILPVKIGKKLLSKDKIDLLPEWARKYCCPVDSGFAKLKTEDGKKDWSCHRCDANGGVGCFYHRVKRLSEITSEEEWKNERKKILEIVKKFQRNDPEYSRELSAELFSTDYNLWKSVFGEGEGRNAEEVSRDREGKSGVRKGLSGVESKDILFQRDTAYLEAVSRGDIETAQRMVDAAADKKITLAMTDSERTEILQTKVITAEVYDGQADALIDQEKTSLESDQFSLVESALLRIADEFDVFTGYNIKDVGIQIEFSKSNLSESVSKKNSPKAIAKLLPVLKTAVENAAGIESHTNRYFFDTDIVRFDNLVGGYADGENFVPVRFGLKHRRNGEAILYVIIDQHEIPLNKIKAEVVEIAGTQSVMPEVSRSAFKVNISDLVQFVNSGDLLRYVPDDMLTESQKQIKWDAIAKTIVRTNKKNDAKYAKYIREGKIRVAAQMVKAAAKDAGYTIEAWHGSRYIFNKFSKSERGSNTHTKASENWFFAGDKDTANSYYPYGVMKELARQRPNNWKESNVENMRDKGKLYSLYLKMENPLIVDVAGYDYAAHAENRDAFMEYVEQADRDGNDGIILLHVRDNQLRPHAEESTVYMFRESSQAKSADPITYDDNDNVVPLSERFNPDNEDIRFQRAFHGTPHDFDKFDLEFINTGEGAQAFGWGLYFAQKEGTAKWYAEKLTKLKNDRSKVLVVMDGKPLPEDVEDILNKRFWLPSVADSLETDEGRAQLKKDIENEIKELTRPDTRLEILSRNLQRIKDNPGLSIKAFLEGVPKEERYHFDYYVKHARQKAKGENRKATINDVASELEKSVQVLQGYRKEDLGIAEKLASIDVDKLSTDVKKYRRNLYTVTIPDDDGTNYLYWDKPIGTEYAERINEGYKEFLPTGPLLEVSENQTGKEVYRALEDKLIDDKEASKLLNSIGFVGIDYPANSMSGGGDGTKRNFVIFNDEDVIVDEHIRFQKELPPMPDSEIVLEASTYDTLEDWLDSRFPEDEESRLLYEAAWHMAQLYNNNDDIPDGVKDVEIERFIERAKSLYENSRLPADFDRVSDDVFGIVSGKNPAENDIETVRRDMANNPELYKALMYDIMLEDTDPESYIDEVFAPTREEKLELASILGDRTELPDDEIDAVLNELRESVKALEKQVIEESAKANEEFAKLPEDEQKLLLAYKDWRASGKKAEAIISRLERSGEITARQTDEAQTLLAKLNAISEYIKETEKSHKAEVKALGKAEKNREKNIIKFYKQRIAELMKAHKTARKEAVALAKSTQKQLVADLKKSLSEEIKGKYDTKLESLREKLKTARKEAVALERLRERRKKLIKKILAPIPKSVSLDVAPKIFELQDFVRKNRRTMKLEDIEKYYKLRKDLVAYGRAVRGAVVDEMKREAESIRNEISRTVRSSKKANRLEDYDPDEVTKANNVLLYGALNMPRLAQILDGGKKGTAYNVLVRDLRSVLSEKSAQISRRTDGVKEELKEIKLSTLEARPYKIELEDSKKPYTPTVADLAYFLLADKNEQNREAVACGNLVLPSEKEQMRRKAEEEVQKEAETNPLEFLGKNIDSEITARTNSKIRTLGFSRFNQVLAVSIRHFSENPKQMELVHLIEEILNRREDFDRLSDAIKEEYNQGVEKVEYYLPIHRLILNGVPSSETVKADLLLRNYSISVDNGIVQERIKISPEHQQAVDTDLIRVFFEAVEKHESLIVVNPYVRKLSRIFINQSANQLKALIRNTYGDSMLRAIENHIKEIAGRYHTSRSSIAKAILWLSGQLHYAYLGLKPSSFILQMATSWGAFLSEVNPVQLAMGISLATFKPGEAKKFVFGKSEMMKNRVIDAIYADSEREMARQRGWKRKLLTLREATTLHLKYADFLCVTGGWIACYDKKYTALVAEGISEAEADKLAIRYADETVAETQPMSESTERAEWFKNTAELYPIMRFTNSLNVVWNNVTYDIPAAIRNKEYSRALGLASGYIISGLLLAIARGLFDEDEDPDKISDEISRLFYAITSQAIQSAPLVGSIADSTAQGLLGLGWKKSFYSTFPFAEKLSEGIGRKDWKKILEALGLLAGVPVSASKEIKRAIEEKDPKQLLGNR